MNNYIHNKVANAFLPRIPLANPPNPSPGYRFNFPLTRSRKAKQLSWQEEQVSQCRNLTVDVRVVNEADLRNWLASPIIAVLYVPNKPQVGKLLSQMVQQRLVPHLSALLIAGYFRMVPQNPLAPSMRIFAGPHTIGLPHLT